jgi:hypothetical protein
VTGRKTAVFLAVLAAGAFTHFVAALVRDGPWYPALADLLIAAALAALAYSLWTDH